MKSEDETETETEMEMQMEMDMEMAECPMSLRLTLSEDEIDEEYNYNSNYNSKEQERDFFFHTHLYSTPFYFKAEKDPGVDLWLQKNLVSEHNKHMPVPVPDLNREVSFTLSCLPRINWNVFKEGGIFDEAVQIGATLVYLLYPKQTLFGMFNVRDSTYESNTLWKSIHHLAKKGFPLEEAFKHIVQLIKDDTTKYSLLTELDVAPMIHDYCSQLKEPRYWPQYKGIPRPFTPEGRTMYDDFKSIVDGMKFPTELEADEHTRLLMSILREKVDTQSLLKLAMEKTNCDEKTQKLLSNLLICNCDEAKPDLILGLTFDNLLWESVARVRSTMKHQVNNAVIPLKQFYYPDSSHFRVSTEVMDLIKVAEIRRLTLGNRFIRRNDFMWAFYEMGHGLNSSFLPPEPLPYECHPPYHIYLTCMKLAQLVVDKVRLESFIFAILHVDHNALNWEMEMLQNYSFFLKALRNSSLKGSDDMEGPIFIRECSDIIGKARLAFNLD